MGVSAYPQLANVPADVGRGSPEPVPFAAAAGALAPMRHAEPFEAQRDRSDAALN